MSLELHLIMLYGKTQTGYLCTLQPDIQTHTTNYEYRNLKICSVL
jgi:hypothetical protein